MKLPTRIAGTFLVRASAAAGSLALAALMVRAYSLGRFGEFSFLYTSVRLVGTFCLFSLDTLLLRMMLRAQERGNRVRSGPVEATAGLAQALALAGFGAIVATSFLFRSIPALADLSVSLLLLSPVALLQPVASMQASLLRAARREAWSQAVLFTIPALLPVAILAIAWSMDALPQHLPELAVLAAHLCAVSIGWALTGLAPLSNLAAGMRRFLGGRLAALRYSAALHAANIMNFATDWYGALLVTLFASFEATGVLRIFQQFAAAFGLLAVSLEVPFSAEIARHHIARRWDDVLRLLVRSQWLLGLLGLALIGAIALFSDLIFGFFALPADRYRGTLLLLLVFYEIVLMTGAAASALALMNCTRRLVRASGIALALAIILQSVLVPGLGLTGAVLGMGLAVSAKAIVNYASVRAEIRTRKSAK